MLGGLTELHLVYFVINMLYVELNVFGHLVGDIWTGISSLVNMHLMIDLINSCLCGNGVTCQLLALSEMSLVHSLLGGQYLLVLPSSRSHVGCISGVAVSSLVMEL